MIQTNLQVNPMLIPGLENEKINYQLNNIGTPSLTTRTIEGIILHSFISNPDYIDLLTEKGLSPDAETLLFLVQSKWRKREIVYVRQAIFYFTMNHVNDITLKSVGHRCGGRDHSTVIHGIQTYKNMCETSRQKYRHHIEMCKSLGVHNVIKTLFK